MKNANEQSVSFNGKLNFVLGLAEMELIFPMEPSECCVFFIGSWKGVDDTLVFWLLQSSAPTTSRLSLQQSPLTSRLGVDQILGGDTARTADTN